MCGIVGYFDYQRLGFQLSSEKFNPMIDSLSHRGPDGRGSYQEPGIGLGHRRLAILDVDGDRAGQPMGLEKREVWLTFNGEIYNYRELKKELKSLGHNFHTTSDTEVLLHSYLEWGVECLEKLNGIFAFAIWDKPKARLWLVRDPFGVKPLFFSDWKGKIIFGSEIPALFHFPDLPQDNDPYGMDSFFTFGYFPAPMTAYKSIKQLLPGEFLLIENGKKIFKKYWDLPLSVSKLKGSGNELREEFKRLLKQAVERQMVSDVDLGAFLSSGKDSFAIVQAMQMVSRGMTTAFSMGFNNTKFDELEGAKLSADTLGVKLISNRMNIDVDKLIEELKPTMQEPFSDPSGLPTYLLCKMASKHVKVVLGGDGADELLGGYEVYWANNLARWYRIIPSAIREKFIRPLVNAIPDFGGKYSFQEKAGRFMYGSKQGPGRDHSSWRVFIPSHIKEKLYTPEFLNEIKDFDPVAMYAKPILRAEEHGCSALDSFLYADLTFYLPNDMLVKVDRMSMAHGLEVRVPFLDPDLVEFCWRLPDRMKIRGGKLKFILREMIKDTYPKELQKQPKSGFNLEYD
ncbi:MAG: asparagine synthase (glutamine-hydrolyzing), partial [Opitutae bacterium]|nr:asparagine synthase (glutamine-hydrolyzing) [Opitutae bacterium]